ncbi:hypothetical protein [Nocardioides sp. InS609-2]|uniref:alpha/beta hydrolase family protein n=1 Tax=Nocardioides sp. InS609-2 TaxID=2760705 RepID=UPI0020C0BF82|nr:hypothetical protein [Nocardioides sp. InS609-2]
MARARASALVLAVVTCLVATTLLWSSATASPRDRHDRGDQPMPGYTISNPPLAPLTIGGQPTRVFQGTHEHAAYVVEAPADWNGELVMWAHGYRGTGTVLRVDAPDYGLRQKLLAQGYAWAASSYARNGYDVRTGVTTTKDLADLTKKLLDRRPSRVYLTGVSMGGHVIGRSLEEYPRFYDGALPMCGVLGDQELFDYFLDYNLVAQDLADVPAYPPTADYLTTAVPAIQQRLGLVGLSPVQDTTNALGKQLRAITVERSGGARPGSTPAFAVWKDFLFTPATPDNGGLLALNPARLAQNADTVYSPAAPVDVNASILRVTPTDPASRGTRRLIEIPTIDGRPKAPVLTLHGLGDLFVPFSMEQIYARDVAGQRQSPLLVQRAIRSAGHCEFSPAEVGRAWDDLTTWVESQHGHSRQGVQVPAGDNVLDPAVVASPTYGCRFSDQLRTGTRALYAPCPAR